jgi:hypothetical protein
MASGLFEYIIKATLAVHRVSERIPSEEPLARMLKEAALRVVADFALLDFHHITASGSGSTADRNTQEEYNKDNAKVSLEILCAYFTLAREEAKRHAWLEPKNFDILTREYRTLWSKLEAESITHTQTFSHQAARQRSSTDRNEKVPIKDTNARSTEIAAQRQSDLENYTRSLENGQFSLNDIAERFSYSSRRTLRRDIHELISRGIVKQDGRKKGTMYHVVQDI